MKAYLLDRYKQDALRLGEIPTPAVGDDDVLIEVHAAGLNLLDSKIRTGEFKAILPYKLPTHLGMTLPASSFALAAMSGISTKATRSIPAFPMAASARWPSSLP